MPYRLAYTATLQQTDSSGNPTGDTFVFNGAQIVATNMPQAADLASLANGMGSDISTQMQAGYPMQAAEDVTE